MVTYLSQIHKCLRTRQLSCLETIYACREKKGLDGNFDLVFFARTRRCMVVPKCQVEALAKTHQQLEHNIINFILAGVYLHMEPELRKRVYIATK